MSVPTIIRARDLSGDWASSLQAQRMLPELVRRLVHATLEKSTLVQFSAEEGIQRPKWDGLVNTRQGNEWVPAGSSGWELTAIKRDKLIGKVTREYANRSRRPHGLDPKNDSIVFVTPRICPTLFTTYHPRRSYASNIRYTHPFRFTTQRLVITNFTILLLRITKLIHSVHYVRSRQFCFWDSTILKNPSGNLILVTGFSRSISSVRDSMITSSISTSICRIKF